MSESSLAGREKPAGVGKWLITLVRGPELWRCHSENTRVGTEWDFLKESGEGRHQATEDYS